jgi:hypothetical protein
VTIGGAVRCDAVRCKNIYAIMEPCCGRRGGRQDPGMGTRQALDSGGEKRRAAKGSRGEGERIVEGSTAEDEVMEIIKSIPRSGEIEVTGSMSTPCNTY